ncbi:hypothetical protein [Marinobacterium halophilum]|uniref:hypothetical protein n=1 Tax=Marinobacterium halophilum TaxID=267374 RepID=UPI0014739E40|nr:hypothetical protein [Marinobacterium halophilum]
MNQNLADQLINMMNEDQRLWRSVSACLKRPLAEHLAQMLEQERTRRANVDKTR